MPVDRGLRTGRRPGHQDTRGAILAAARTAFADRGFSGASMREIARGAGVDAALIHHYFDSKQQLFLATIRLPVDLPRIIDSVAAGGLAGLGERLLTTLLRIWDSEAQPGLVAAVRTALTEPAMGRPMREFLTSEVLERVLAPAALPSAEATERAGLVASQLLGLIVGRYLLRLPALADRPAADLVADLAPNLQRYLDGTYRAAG